MSLIRNATAAALMGLLVCGLSACMFMSHKTPEQRQADQETADRVQAALSADRELYSRHITVRADGNVVSLQGYVWTQPELEEALRIAEGVQGVDRVVNDLELERGGISNSQVSR